MALFNDLIIRFGGDDSRLQKTVKRVRSIGTELQGHFGKIGELFGRFGRGGIAGVIAGVGAAFAAAARSSLGFADNLALTADKIGVSVEELQELRYWAKTVGVEQGTLDTALQRFARRLGEAANGTGVLYNELQQAGIRIRDSEGNLRRTTDVLRDYAEATKNARDRQTQLRMTVAGFDTEAAGLVNAIAQGGAAMDSAAESARELGIILEEDLVRQAAEMETEWQLTMQRMDLLWKGWILSVVEYLDDLRGVLRTVEEMEERRAENLAEIDRLETQLEKTRRGNRASMVQRIKDLKEENAQLEEQIKLKKEAAKQQDNLNQANETGREQAEKDKQTASSEDWREKTPEQIAAALDAFRRGEISAAELGERAGLQPPGTVESLPPGAHGTQENRGRGAFSSGGELVVGADVENLNRQLEAFFAGTQYEIRVRPTLVGEDAIEGEEGFEGSETGGLPAAADQLGIRQ